MDSIIVYLRRCVVFSDLSDEELDCIARLCDVEKFNAGDTVYSQGSRGVKLYVLAEGEVGLERTIGIDDLRKARVPVFTFRETPSRRLMGGWFALVGEEHAHMCTAVCNTAATLISIECPKLKNYIANNTKVKAKILEKLIILLRDRIDSSYKAMETL